MTTKMTLGLALLLLGLLSPQPASRYVVVDLDSGEPIAYVSVYPMGQPPKATLSIEDGSFELPASTPNDTLVFSHVSYGVQNIPVAAILGDTVRLRARDFTLDEVAIVSETGEDIFRKVIKAANKNHAFNNTPYFSQSWKTISSPDRGTLHAFFELDGFLLHKKIFINEEYSMLRSRSRSWTGLGKAWLEDTPLYSNGWISFYVGGRAPHTLMKRPRSVKDYHVKIIGTHRERSYHVMELELTPKAPNADQRYIFFIDLDSYAVIRFLAQQNPTKTSDAVAPSKGRNYQFYEYEERFAEVDGVWHRIYLRYLDKGYFQGQEILEEEINLAQVAEWDAEKQANARPFKSLVTDEPITNFQIPWEDPYWQSRPSVPWSKWVTEQLAAKGLVRER